MRLLFWAILPIFVPQLITSLDRSDHRFDRPSSGWSRAIEERYALTLSADWAEWFDEIAVGELRGGEYCEPVHPSELLSATPEVIWPGLMPPDLMPVVGNGMGDWLCARVGPESTIRELVHWYHGGGDRLPFGKTLAEAFVFDALRRRLPGSRRRLAIPAEEWATGSLSPEESIWPAIGADGSGSGGSGDGGLGDGAVSTVGWALGKLPPRARQLFDAGLSPERLGSELISQSIASEAVACDLVLGLIDSEVQRRLTAQDATALGVSWDRECVRWIYDPATIPPGMAEGLAARWGIERARWEEPDWDGAAWVAQEVCNLRSDLAWAWEVVAYRDHRQDKLVGVAPEDRGVVGRYLRGSLASSFTDQSVRFRSHFDTDLVSKFSVARLLELGAAEVIDPAYLALLLQSPASDPRSLGWRDRVSAHWLSEADRGGSDPLAIRAVNDDPAPDSGYNLIYRAGWDVGCDSIRQYKLVLERLATAADAAGQHGRAALARTHRDCLVARYLRR